MYIYICSCVPTRNVVRKRHFYPMFLLVLTRTNISFENKEFPCRVLCIIRDRIQVSFVWISNFTDKCDNETITRKIWFWKRQETNWNDFETISWNFLDNFSLNSPDLSYEYENVLLSSHDDRKTNVSLCNFALNSSQTLFSQFCRMDIVR